MLLMTLFNSPLGASELHPDKARSSSEEAPFALKQYQWRNRVLVISAENVDDNNLLEQAAELALTPDEFADRDMVLEVTAVRAPLGIRPGSFALRLIGKDGSVKLSAKKATSMTEIYALIDSMPMRQRENSKR
jgi:hypothetical protein